MNRRIYQVRESLKSVTANALYDAYRALRYEARDGVSAAARRDSAASARALIAAFGCRIDRKRKSPFARVPVDRARCFRCEKSELSGLALSFRHVVANLPTRYDLGRRPFCADCERDVERRALLPNPVYVFADAAQSEASCAA